MAARNTSRETFAETGEAPAARATMVGAMDIWEGLRTPDPRRTKRFQRSGGFKGTAVAPIHVAERLTRVFGPCGFGWGWDIKQVDYVPPAAPQVVNVTIRFWWRMSGLTHSGDVHLVPNGRAEFDHVGGSAMVKGSGDKARYDDEALKGAVTDAIGKAALQIGMSADIHLGLFDDNKYVKEAEELFDETEKAERPAEAGRSEEPEKPRRSKEDEIREWADNVVSQVNRLPNKEDSLALLKGIRSGAKDMVQKLGEGHAEVERVKAAIIAKREAIDEASPG